MSCSIHARSLLFYHPVVWWLSKQIRIEREQIADDLAAGAIGEPHRLALALHELDAFQQDQLQRLGEFPGAFHLVPAANGGHLMSRIQRLIRPNQHALDWKMALPLTCLSIVGLTAACLSVYAHDATPAVMPTTATTATSATPVVLMAMTSPTSATPTPVARTTTSNKTSAAHGCGVALPSVASAATAGCGGAAISHSSSHDHDAFALIRVGQAGMTMSGDTRDIPAIERTKQKVHGDFVWVRRGGKAYVVQDPAVIARVVGAWQPAEAMGKQMEALSAKMEAPSKQMEDLGRQMETVGDKQSPYTAAMEKTSAQMEALGRQQEALGNKMQHANDAERETLDRQMEALEAQMRPLEQQMDKLGATMDAHGKDMEAAQKPMEDLSKQMEEASKPMEELGKQMDALAKQEDQLSHEADLKVKSLIDEAMRDDKATSTDVLR